jgi:group I intron endonuclease
VQGTIYCITCTGNGKRYIGGTIMHVTQRWTHHLNDLKRGVHCNAKLQNAFNKYGEVMFIFTVLETCDAATVLEREKFWIDKLRVVAEGFNVLADPRAPMTGHATPVEVRRKISRSLTGRTRGPMNEAQKQKIAAACRKTAEDPAQREKMSLAQWGHLTNSATRTKLAAANQQLTWEQVCAIRARFVGVTPKPGPTAPGVPTVVGVAAEFNTSPTVIRNILQGKTYRRRP